MIQAKQGSPMTRIVMAGYVRTPFHFANKGKLTDARPDLPALAIKALVACPASIPDPSRTPSAAGPVRKQSKARSESGPAKPLQAEYVLLSAQPSFR